MSDHEVTELTLREQVAIVETIGFPPSNVRSGTVIAVTDSADPDHVTVVWQGVSRIPRAQLDAVRTAVAAELALAELNAPPAYADADHSNHAMCDPTLGCIEREQQE